MTDNLHFKLHYDSKCVVCGAQTPGNPIGEVMEHEYDNTTKLVFPVYQCPVCRLVYLYPRPDSSELSTIYPSDYYAWHLVPNAAEKGKRTPFVQSVFHYLNTRRYKKRLSSWIKHRTCDKPIKVLDIGCGVGGDLDIFKTMFPDCVTYGIELHKEAVVKARLRGHKIYHGRFEEIDFPDNYFDIVSSFHVIEHLAKPDEFVRKSLKIINDQGVIHIETPNTSCIDFKLFKSKHWGGYHPPRHWYLFQFKTFEKLITSFHGKITGQGFSSAGVFWNWTFHSILKKIVGQKPADYIFPPVKIYYGGFQSLALLSICALWERALMILTGRMNSLWILAAKDKKDVFLKSN